MYAKYFILIILSVNIFKKEEKPHPGLHIMDTGMGFPCPFQNLLDKNPISGKIIHSVEYKDAVTNGMEGKRVLVVGIGNSAVDVATNCASEGR